MHRSFALLRMTVGWGMRCLGMARDGWVSTVGGLRIVQTLNRCHPERSEGSMHWGADMGWTYHPSLRSFQSGFMETISAIFFMRSNPLICFSRVMALPMR